MKMNLQFFADADSSNIQIGINKNDKTTLATKEKYVAENIDINVQDVFTYNQPENITKISSTEQKGLRYNIKGTNNYDDDGYIEFCNGSTYEQKMSTGCGASLKFYPCSDVGDSPAVDIYDANNKLAAVFLDGTLDNVKEKTVDLNLASGNQTVQDAYYQYQESPVDVPGDINYYFSKVTINKPATLLATNIKKDITIAGVTGTYEGVILPTYMGLLRFDSNPTISLSNSTLTITAVPNATSYDIYKDNTLLSNVTTTTVDLSTLITTAGTYAIYVIAKASNYVDSDASDSVSYEVSSEYDVVLPAANWGKDAYCEYSIDDGVTWVTMSTATTIQTSQIKFKSVGSRAYNYTLSSTLLGMQLYYGNTSQNYILTQDITDINIELYICFVQGTQITLANGTTKNVEDITYNDELLVWNFYEGKYDTAKPSWIMIPMVANFYKQVTFSDGSTLNLVGSNEKSHRLYNITKQKFLYANECVGDEVFTQRGILKVVAYDIIEKEVNYYNLTTEKYYDCFADGVLTGSRLNNMYHISEDMKYDSDIRLISEEEEAERWRVREAIRLPK